MSTEALKQEAEKRKTPVDDRGMIDVPFLALVLLLVGIGLLMMFSASYVRAEYEQGDATYFFLRQGGVALFGIFVMYAASRISCQIWKKFAVWVYALSIVLLLLVLLVGEEVNGAKRWVTIAGQQFQPSEVAKFGVICIMAMLMDKYGEKMQDWHYSILRVGGSVFLIVLLVALEKHLSAIMIIGLVAVAMLFVGGIQKRWIFIGVGATAIFLVLYISIMGYAGNRITAWLNPDADPQNTGYQILQSQYAIGSGGLFGLGFGMGRQKHLYLPEEHNDYIFAVVCEELGLVGALGIILLFVLLILRGYWIALHAKDRFSTLMGVGLSTLLAVQVFLNIGVVSNLLPSTGVGLPFFSYGGTNLLMALGEMGIILSISRWSSSTR